jgi:hypothetical protein
MKRTAYFRRILFTAIACFAIAGAAMAQTGLTYSIVSDSVGNTIAQLAGDHLTIEQVGTELDSLPGTVRMTPPPPPPPPAAPAGWTATGWGNGALDIAASPQGGAWFTAASGSIYTAGTPNLGTQHIGGGVAVRMAVDGYGVPWSVTSGKAIFYYMHGVWNQTPGAAIDIAAGGDSVYILNPDGSLAKWNGSGWTPFAGGGGGTRIAVDEKGYPWVVNASNQIFRWNGTQWQQLLGAAQDISISPDGAAYVIGMPQGTGGYMVYKWDNSVSNWNQIGVYGTVVAGASGGHVYVARAASSMQPTIMR